MTIINNTQANRYELLTEGHLSLADYQLRGSTLIITHVGVPPELRGRGIAVEVMKAVVEDAKQRNLSIEPLCSYAAAYMQRNKEAS